ncbi:MAG: N-6 DNA methylase, partial [Cyanobacteria bacterium REEB67]|nr:N-6 DNA methylase [Cyanobacteria bacterium REEB67]
MARAELAPNLSEESDDHLLVLRRLVRGLEKDCRPILGVRQAEAGDHFQSTRLLALVGLAKRRLRPSSLQAGSAVLLSGIESWLEGLGEFDADVNAEINVDFDFRRPATGHATFGLDASGFAEHCCRFLLPWNALSKSQVEALLAALDKNWRQALGKKQKSAALILKKIATDPLTIGWGHEFLAGAAIAASASAAPSDNYLQKTQFFTPDWIADFLCQQSLAEFLEGDSREAGEFTLLDPACGAGHLLVGAVNAVMRQTVPEERLSRLEILLEHSIYGLDLDPSLLELAAFSIYLTARDWLKSTD